MAGGSGGGDISGDSERRLKKAMDKLYHFPKPKPNASPKPSSSNSSSGRAGRGTAAGRRFGMVRGSRLPQQVAAMAALSPPPPCRPWDRGDLMRRLASFKAMTWFAKPKAINPVNCARRGWTNIEPDVITCEACGARLLFSTPSSWTSQQVEKAAAVFSLKLDTGHKLLCPWIDNICDESLALFPPTPPPVLVENYYQCFSSLLRLSALPRISCSSLESMKKRSPQLEQFLSEPFSSSVVLKGGFLLTEDSTKDIDDAFRDANTYYQALKIISLCGWEPRLLPYAVDCGTKSQSDANSTSTFDQSEQITNTMEGQVTLYSTNELDSTVATADATQGDQQYDPSSVVLDCQFCGACVALWPFSIVGRPLQLFKLIADSNGQVEQNNGHGDLVGALGLPKSASVGFNFTIAGGPPPTRQNFRPRVSFPVVSRHLKADLSSCGKSFSSKPESDRDPVALQSAGSLKRKRSMNEPSILESDNASGHTSSTDVDTLTKGKKHDQQEDNSEKNIANLDKHKQECSHSDKNKDTDMEEASCGEEPETGADTIKIIRSTNVELDQHSSEPELRKVHVCEAPSDHRNLVEAHVSSSRQIEVATNTQTSLNKEKGACQTSGREALYDRMDEFDPIKQHRTFCPWIALDNGEALPGWRLTLSALCSQEKISNGDRQVEAQTSLLDEEDDPLTCVRELFMTPSSKKSRSIQRADES